MTDDKSLHKKPNSTPTGDFQEPLPKESEKMEHSDLEEFPVEPIRSIDTPEHVVRAQPKISFDIDLRESRLVSATIRFQTLNDNKERSSGVSITIRDYTNQIIAFIDSIFDEFQTRRLYGPYDLRVTNPVPKSWVRPGGSATLYFIQGANDEWHTNFLIDLAFSDGSHLAIEEQDVAFTGANPKQIFGF